MATIEQRRTEAGERRYRALVRLKGYPPQSATFRRLTDARRWAADTESAIREGRYFKTSEAKRHTLAEAVDRYLTDVLPSKRKGQGKDKALLNWWRDQLGAYALADVTPPLIAQQRDELLRGKTNRGTQRSPSTANRYLQALSHLFSVARDEWEWIDENPVRRVRKLREPRGRVRVLTDEERGRLLDACQKSQDERLYPLVVLALSTGARVGELLRLTWPDIDYQRGVAILHETKNNERRAIPIVGLAAKLLREMSKVRRLDTNLVFANTSGKARFPQKKWEEALKTAEIEDFRFHDLRHSAASYLAMNGATLAEIAEVLGHKTLAMVKRYSHLTEQHVSGVVQRMNEAMFGEVD